jgi:hypothetical protein
VCRASENVPNVFHLAVTYRLTGTWKISLNRGKNTVDEFLNELVELCKKHHVNMAATDDGHGSPVIDVIKGGEAEDSRFYEVGPVGIQDSYYA